jgi:DHA1 family multidrug resistance protein-like MFS transporter
MKISSGTSSVVQSYVADVTSREDRGKEIGRVGAFSSFGLVIGPVAGIFFGYSISPIQQAWFVAALTGAGISLLNFFLVLVFVKESPTVTIFFCVFAFSFHFLFASF